MNYRASNLAFTLIVGNWKYIDPKDKVVTDEITLALMSTHLVLIVEIPIIMCNNEETFSLLIHRWRITSSLHFFMISCNSNDFVVVEQNNLGIGA